MGYMQELRTMASYHVNAGNATACHAPVVLLVVSYVDVHLLWYFLTIVKKNITY